jgi:S1-C subfamily serine protease
MSRLKTSSSLLAVLVSATIFFSLWNGRERSPEPAGALTSLPPYRSEEEQRTIDIYKRAKDAVVFITTITLTVDPFDIFMEYQPRQGTGSGVIVDGKKGIVLTNLHVIGEAHKIEVALSDGKNYSAHLVGFDKETDIAVLQIDKRPSALSALSFGDSSKVEVGQRVIAIGNPFGLNKTMTTGIVSSVERSVRSPTGNVLRSLIQTDAAINPGNSGGPLIDMSGSIIGINTAILSQSGDSAGIGFAMPVNSIARILPELIATGKVLRAWMGWDLIDTREGPMVLRLTEGSPASVAGLQPIERRVDGGFMRGFVRDFEGAALIKKINGRIVQSKEEVETIISGLRDKNPLKVTVRRGGAPDEERTLTIIPAFR